VFIESWVLMLLVAIIATLIVVAWACAVGWERSMERESITYKRFRRLQVMATYVTPQDHPLHIEGESGRISTFNPKEES
jgi:hypothetical protein